MPVRAWILVFASWLALPAQAAGLRVEVVTTDFVMPARIAALDAITGPEGVRFVHRVVGGARSLPDHWPQGADLVLLDTPRPSDAEQVMASAGAALAAGQVPWLRIGGGAPASGGLSAAQARRIADYYGNGGESNVRSLGRWLSAWRDADPGIQSLPGPELLGAAGYYAGAGVPAPAPGQLQAYWSQQGQAAWPKVGVVISANTISSMQTQVLDALIEAGRRHEVSVFGFWFDQQDDNGLHDAVASLDVAALVNLTHMQNGSARTAEFAQVDVPVIQALNHRQGDAAQWRAASSGVPMSLLATFIALPETWGVSDPIVLSASEHGAMLPIPEQVEALAAKLARMAALRNRAAADKRLALLFWNAPDGEKNLSASHLNVPRSIAALSQRLQAAGYPVTPANEQALIDDAQALLGGYYRPQSLDGLLARDLAVAFPIARYTEWLRTLPAQRRDELLQRWGDPGKHPSVRRIAGEPSFILPRLKLGNLLVMPQPPRAGQVGQATHDLESVPSHYYLAAYLYLRSSWQADALIHLGTHGTQEWTPGKDRGLWAGDYPWLAVGDLPVFYPYIQDNVGEAVQAKRRGRAVVVSHQTPAFAPSGLYDELRDLHQLVHEFQQLDQGQARDATAAQLRELAWSSGIAGDMGWAAIDMQVRFPAFLQALHDHMHELARRQLPLGLHTFGEPAEPAHRLLTVMQQLGPSYLHDLGLDPEEVHADDAEAIRQGMPYRMLSRYLREGEDIASVVDGPLRAQLLRARQFDAALADTQEFESLLRGLEGGFVLPGTGGDPIRSPEVRSGRNLYAFEPDRIPTQAAFVAGRQALDQLLQAYRQEHGAALPDKLAISLWSSEAIRHLGVLEAQVLHAMGLAPRWDAAGKVVALDIVPDTELQHPRIDVVVQATSVYRDQFDPFLRLLADAVARLAAMPATPRNPIARHAQALRTKLQGQGIPADQATALAALRIFSNAPGTYGSGLTQQVLDRDGAAGKDDAALANGFLERLQHGYDGQGRAITLPDGNLFAEQLRGVQAAVLSRSSNLHGLLSTDHPFEYLGGLALAVRHLDGSTPSLYVSDLRKAEPSTTSAARFLADELRSGVLNPQWIGAMKDEGYAGTLEVLKTTDNLFGWQVTAPGTVRDEQWQALHDTYVRDSRGQGIAEWFERGNPTAQAQLIQRLQEAIARGYWDADDSTRQELQARLDALSAMTTPPAAAPAVAASPGGFGLQAPSLPSPAPSPGSAPPLPAAVPAAANVRGRVMQEVPKPAAAPPPRTHIALLGLLFLFATGVCLQARSNAGRPIPRA